MVFGEDSLVDALAATGWRADEPTFFQWLGVTLYLTAETSMALFAYIAGLTGSTIVFDYSLPPQRQTPAGRTATPRR